MNVHYPATLDKLGEMLEFIHQQAKILGFDEESASKVELALEEALVNIIKYAYKGKNEGALEINCEILSSPAALKIVLKDQGTPFNPLKQGPLINNEIAVDDKPIGGYGIFLIRKIMDKVDYVREADSNVFTLLKYADSQAL